MKKILKIAGSTAFIVGIPALAWFSLAVSIMAVCAIVLVVLVGKLESLVEFSFGPLKAKIERNLSKSEQLLDDLKRFATIQAKAAINANVYNGRWGAEEDDRVFHSVRSVEQGLRGLGFDDAEIREARREFVRLTIFDAAHAVLGGSTIPKPLSGGDIEEWKNLRRELEVDVDAIEGFLRRFGQNDPAQNLLIEDMRWMTDHGDVKDVDQYLRAHRTIEWSAK